jgi:hypothetical protein
VVECLPIKARLRVQTPVLLLLIKQKHMNLLRYILPQVYKLSLYNL